MRDGQRRARLRPAVHWPALLLIGLSLAMTARAQSDPLVEAREARSWLARIHEAAAGKNFQGTFVVSTGGSVASSRIAHYCDGPNQYERIESLDGLQRQVFRHNEIVHTLWPSKRLAVIETRQAMSQFPALLPADGERIAKVYELKPQGVERVAGHEANVLWLRPKDGWRYGYRLWSEKTSGLLLRAEVIDERDEVLEASAFSEVTIGVAPQLDKVTVPMKRLEGWQVEKPVLVSTQLAEEGWRFHDLPPGFRLVNSVRRPGVSLPASSASAAAEPIQQGLLQTIYSDGLTYVSVFIEPYDGSVHRRQLMMTMGATRTMTLRQGDWWLTIIGDVPVATLKAFASGLQRRS